MKRVLGFGSVVVACFFLLPVAGSAESAVQDAEAEIIDGGISIEVPSRFKLEFKDIGYEEYQADKYFHPKVVAEQFSYPVSLKESLPANNPYDNEVVDQPLRPGSPAMDAIVRVENYNLSHPEFKVTVSRTGFFHKETGQELTGVHLYMGEFMDISDYQEIDREKPFEYDPREIEGKDKYWLAGYLNIEEGKSNIVADYRGTSGLGIRYLSPFSYPHRDYKGRVSTGMSFGRSYTEENIALGVDHATRFPAAGTYVTSITWVIELTP